MVPAPLRPRQNALVIVSLFLVAGALFPWSSRLRLSCAAAAGGIVLVLLVSRLRMPTGVTRDARADDTQERIDTIRAARDARMRRPR